MTDIWKAKTGFNLKSGRKNFSEVVVFGSKFIVVNLRRMFSSFISF